MTMNCYFSFPSSQLTWTTRTRLQEQLLDGPRYQLRPTKAAQLKPYTIDQLKYKQTLKANLMLLSNSETWLCVTKMVIGIRTFQTLPDLSDPST